MMISIWTISNSASDQMTIGAQTMTGALMIAGALTTTGVLTLTMTGVLTTTGAQMTTQTLDSAKTTTQTSDSAKTTIQISDSAQMMTIQISDSDLMMISDGAQATIQTSGSALEAHSMTTNLRKSLNLSRKRRQHQAENRLLLHGLCQALMTMIAQTTGPSGDRMTMTAQTTGPSEDPLHHGRLTMIKTTLHQVLISSHYGEQSTIRQEIINRV